MSKVDFDLSRRKLLASIAAGTAAMLLPRPAEAYVFTPAIDDKYVPFASRWLLRNFGEVFAHYAQGTPYTLPLFCAFACQESGYAWWRRSFRGTKSVEDVLQSLVLDDGPGRSADLVNEGSMVASSAWSPLLPRLVAAADATRTAQKEKKPAWHRMRYGYGLFQYDLNNIRTDPDFWTVDAVPAAGTTPTVAPLGQWRSVEACTQRLVKVLNDKMEATHGDLELAIRYYNGSNPNSLKYRDTVLRFARIIEADQRASSIFTPHR